MLAVGGLLWDLNYSPHGHICLTKLVNEPRTMMGHLSRQIKGQWGWDKGRFLDSYKWWCNLVFGFICKFAG